MKIYSGPPITLKCDFTALCTLNCSQPNFLNFSWNNLLHEHLLCWWYSTWYKLVTEGKPFWIFHPWKWKVCQCSKPHNSGLRVLLMCWCTKYVRSNTAPLQHGAWHWTTNAPSFWGIRYYIFRENWAVLGTWRWKLLGWVEKSNWWYQRGIQS